MRSAETIQTTARSARESIGVLGEKTGDKDFIVLTVLSIAICLALILHFWNFDFVR